MRKKDQSTKFIKMCLAEALIQLLKRGHSYAEINVTEICQVAGIGRTTYYRHFDNKSGKDNLIRFKIFNAWEQYCIPRTEELKISKLNVLLNFFYSEKELFLLLHRINLTMIALFDVLYLSAGPQEGDDKDAAYFKALFASSIFGMVYRWLETGFEDSPEHVFGLISALYPNW